jgi:kynurenine formamidase
LIVAILCSASTALGSDLEDFFSKIQQGSYELVDLSHVLKEGIPFFPGGTPFQLEEIANFKNATYASNRFSMGEHTGTHMDAPIHLSEGGSTIDKIPLKDFIVWAAVVDVRDQVRANSEYELSMDRLLSWERRYGQIAGDSVVLLLTGWGSHCDNPERYRNVDENGIPHFPGFSREVAEFLASNRNVKGLGTDALSVDPGRATQLDVHRIMHGKGKFHLENLAHLDRLPPTGALLFVFPLSIEGGTGAPLRAWALVPKGEAVSSRE